MIDEGGDAPCWAHLFEDGGHWLLETHLDQIVARIRPFLSRVREASGPW